MPFGAKKRECAATAEHLEAVEWAKGLKGSAAWVIEDIKRQLELDPAAALRACPERKKIWEEALDSVPAPSAGKQRGARRAATPSSLIAICRW